jgi:hypothetical protein
MIGWTTNQPADSQVDFGLTTAYGSTTTLDAALVTSHSQNLTGLDPGATYHYRIRSTNASGLGTVSGDFVFSTLAVTLRLSAGNSNDATSTTIAQALGSTVAGNLIVAVASWGTNSTMTCSDTQGNTYTTLPVQFDGPNSQALGMCYAANIAGGNVTVTATFGASSGYRRLIVHEYTGIAANPFDGTAGNIANGTTVANNVTTTAITTTAAGDLIFAAVMDDAGLTGVTGGTNFTLRTTLNGTDLATEDRVLTTAGSVTGTWTFTAAHRYIARIVAFKAAGK